MDFQGLYTITRMTISALLQNYKLGKMRKKDQTTIRRQPDKSYEHLATRCRSHMDTGSMGRNLGRNIKEELFIVI